MVDTAVSNKLKADVKGRDADNIIYLYKRIKHEPLANKIHILGLQGATSGTNTRTLQSTATKRANIKGVGSINQQRTVDVIFSAPEKNKKDLYWDLYAAWEKGELIGLWRMDLNTVHGTKPNRKIQAQFSKCYVPNLPNTEALGGTMTSNLQFEVNGMERAINSDENAFELNEIDLDEGILDNLAKFYNFSHGTDLGTDENGEFVDNTEDDDTIEVQDTTTGEDVMGPAYKPVENDDADSKDETPEDPQDVQSKANGTGADISSK
jgi:hypothetical protein